MEIQPLAELSDSDLLVRVRGLVRNERRATAALVAHLAEIENRKLYLGEACGSLFTYCIRVLHLSEPAAYNRIQAARAARRFPAVLVSLEQGLVHLAAVRLLAPVLTAENHHDLLSAATHKSKREVEELLARLRPQPDVPGQVRKLPAAQNPVPPTGLFGNSAAPSAQQPAIEQTTREPAALEPAAPRGADARQPAVGPKSPEQRAVVVPLAPERYKVQFTAGAATREKLRRAQELLRHRIPDGDIAQVIDVALELLVRDLERKKFAATGQPRRREPTNVEAPGGGIPQPNSNPASRYIAAELRRAVWVRDQGRCTFVSPAGERCAEQGQLEFDHIRPHADGGSADMNNVRLLCRQHNQHESRQFFGLWRAGDTPHSAARCP